MRRKIFSLFLVFPLVVKLAVLYTDERDCFKVTETNKLLRPTFRISWKVYPKIKRPKITAAISEISKTGQIKPYGVVVLTD